VGRVGGDAALSYTSTGIALCKFSVAVSKVTGKGEARKEKTTWVRISLWRERAENLSQYIKKGNLVMVIGEIDVSAYTDKQGQYLAFIVMYTKLHRRPPAEADIQAYFQVTPPSVHNMIVTLERRGLISKAPGTPRSIRVLVEAERLPALA